MDDMEMISFLIHVLELTLLGLVAYLAYQVLKLFNSYQNADASKVIAASRGFNVINQPQAHNYSRAESITSAQIFAGLQLFEIKRNGINPLSPGQDWIDNGISYYLLGAASAITEHFECSGNDKDDVMRYLLTKNLNYSNELAEQCISKIYQVDEQDIEQNAFYAGIDAAKTWLTKKFIPDEHSLLNNLNSLGFVA